MISPKSDYTLAQGGVKQAIPAAEGAVEKPPDRVLDSAARSISTRGSHFGNNLPSPDHYASSHTSRRQGDAAEAADGLHAEAGRARLQPPVPALPDRHAQAGRRHRHHALALLPAAQDRGEARRRFG